MISLRKHQYKMLAVLPLVFTNCGGCGRDGGNILLPTTNNRPPQIKTLSPLAPLVQIGTSVRLKAKANDPEGSVVSYKWESVNGSFSGNIDSSNIVTWIAPMTVGSFKMKLTVTDDLNASSSRTITIETTEDEVTNTAPEVNYFTIVDSEGGECNKQKNDSATCNGSPNNGSLFIKENTWVELRVHATDPDGDQLTYMWFQSAGSLGGNTTGTLEGSTTTDVVRWKAPDLDDLDETIDVELSVEVTDRDGQVSSLSAIGTVYVEATADRIDSDGDGFSDLEDNCPRLPNPDQINSDNDAHGDVCDNCPDTDNPNQEDSNANDIGDACDSDTSCTEENELNYYRDKDGDGVPGKDSVLTLCEPTPIYKFPNPSVFDCDDNDPNKTNNCANETDCDASEKIELYIDEDVDGFGTGAPQFLCDALYPYTVTSLSNGEDCDDSNNYINQNQLEICDNYIDDNCNGDIDENCDPEIPQCSVSTLNCTDGIDNDCDGNIDEEDENCDTNAGDGDGSGNGSGECSGTLYYLDADFDGVPTENYKKCDSTDAIPPMLNYITDPDLSNGYDCDDLRGYNFPGNTEDCGDLRDNDCDGDIDQDDDDCIFALPPYEINGSNGNWSSDKIIFNPWGGASGTTHEFHCGDHGENYVLSTIKAFKSYNAINNFSFASKMQANCRQISDDNAYISGINIGLKTFYEGPIATLTSSFGLTAITNEYPIGIEVKYDLPKGFLQDIRILTNNVNNMIDHIPDTNYRPYAFDKNFGSGTSYKKLRCAPGHALVKLSTNMTPDIDKIYFNSFEIGCWALQ